MCTFTFIPKLHNGFIVTSNRDEAPNRETIPPEIYEIEGVKTLFPKDARAGGTWIGVSEKNRLVSLLNGGFEPHDRKDSYRMSRGIIVKDLLIAEDAVLEIEKYDFKDIEPFTIILIDWAKQLKIFELVWDGNHSYFEEKDLVPQIWASSLLYSKEYKEKRQQWFSLFLNDRLDPTKEELIRFHKTAGEGNIENDLVMDRGFVKTTSITQVVINNGLSMRYEELGSGAVFQNSL